MVSGRVHIPALGINVARDAFIAPMLAMLIVGPLCVLWFVVRPSSTFKDFLDAHHISFALIAFVMTLVGVLSLTALAATVLGDPGLLPTPAAEHSTTAFREEDEAHYCRCCCCYVYKYDHHCGVVGACIGGRNMWSFVSFLGLSALLSLIGLPLMASFVYYNLQDISALTVHQVTSHITFPVILGLMCCMAAVQGGTYSALMCGVYIVHIVRGTDTVMRRHPPTGHLPPTLPSSWRYRLKRCFAHAWTWRSAFTAQCMLDGTVCDELHVLATSTTCVNL